MVENKKFLKEAQPTFVAGRVVAGGPPQYVPLDVVGDVLVFKTPDITTKFGTVSVFLVPEAGFVA